MQARTKRWSALVGTLAVAAFVAARASRPRRVETGPPPAGAAELRLVAPLAPGGTLGDWQVRAVSAVTGGAVHVMLDRGTDSVDLAVYAAAPTSPPAPGRAGDYAVFYAVDPPWHASEADAARLAQSLADIVARTGAPRPPGLAVAAAGAGGK